MDAGVPLCPTGSLCIRPLHGKTGELPPLNDEGLLGKGKSYYGRRLAGLGRMIMPQVSLAAEPPELVTSHRKVFGVFEPWQKVSQSRRLRSIDLPAAYEPETCPAGYFCPAGSVAEVTENGQIEILTAGSCSIDGIACAPGTMIPRALDVVALPGFYVAPDGTGLIACPPGTSCPGGSGASLPQSCPPGTFQISAGAPRCQVCTAGTICPGFGGGLPQLCPAGMVCTSPGRLDPSFLCPAGSFCKPGTFTLNSQADFPGAPSICGNGTYCLPGTATTEVDPSDPTAPKPCVDGTFCGANVTTPGGTSNCPAGWYCPQGVNVPQPSPPGHFSPGDGTVYPIKCSPGWYAPEWLSKACLPCPPGYECPLDGTVSPVLCKAGTYRPLDNSGRTVRCIPCPQGTWSNKVGLVSESECSSCPERYVCPMEGMTRFATLQEKCMIQGRPTDGELCYDNSQGYDCPSGYACDAETTYFTKHDFPCEPGYWCPLRTALRERRAFLCPEGHYCLISTSQANRKANKCPAGLGGLAGAGHFCPQGTGYGAIYDDTGGVSFDFFNVQANRSHVFEMEAETMAKCEIHDIPKIHFDRQLFAVENLWSYPTRLCGDVLSQEELDAVLDAVAAGDISHEILTMEIFQNEVNATTGSMVQVKKYVTPRVEWQVLRCPPGTKTIPGSSERDDCKNMGIVIAVLNIDIWQRERFDASKFIDGTLLTYPFGTPLQGYPGNPLIKFYGMAPPMEGREFDMSAYNSVTVQAMEIIIFKFDFSKLGPDIKYDINGDGHYKIVIHSDARDPSLAMNPSTGTNLLPYEFGAGAVLPSFFRNEFNEHLNYTFEIQVLALVEMSLTVNVQLLHGSYLPISGRFNHALDYEIRQPNRTVARQRDFFVVVLDKDMITANELELPFNLEGYPQSGQNGPGKGSESLVLDLVNSSGRPNIGDQTITPSPPSTYFGNLGQDKVLLPWLPFFSSCDVFDSHIVIWDLFEKPREG